MTQPTTIISVDSSGHVGQPPIIMLATKHTHNGQSKVALEIDEATHLTYEGCTVNWKEKLAAALIFRAVVPIFGPQHSLIIDFDFNNTPRRNRVEEYLRRLFGKNYYGKPSFANPSISWATRKNPYVKIADQKAYAAHLKRIPRKVAPNLMGDIRSL